MRNTRLGARGQVRRLVDEVRRRSRCSRLLGFWSRRSAAREHAAASVHHGRQDGAAVGRIGGPEDLARERLELVERGGGHEGKAHVVESVESLAICQQCRPHCHARGRRGRRAEGILVAGAKLGPRVRAHALVGHRVLHHHALAPIVVDAVPRVLGRHRVQLAFSRALVEQRLADEELGKDVEHVLEARRVHFEVVNRLLRRRRRVAPSVVQRDHLLVVRLGWVLFGS